jgi:hypothetical protein
MIKRFKVVAVALAAFGLVSTAFADGMEVTGKARMRAEQHTIGTAATGDWIGMATEVNMKWTPDPKVQVFFQPKFFRNMGTTMTGAQGAAGVSGGTVDSALDLHQAYTTYMPTEKAAYTWGRYEMKYGDELVIGPVGWSLVGRSFDGFKGHWVFSDMFWLDGFYNKITETTTAGNPPTGPTATADKNFYGLYFGAKPSAAIAEADLYYLVVQNNTPSGTGTDKTEDRATMGLRVKGATGPVDYRAEWSSQSGKDYTGFQATNGDIKDADQLNAEVGFKFGDTRVSAEHSNANKNYHQLYPTGHKWLGYQDLFGRRNITQLRVGASHKFMEHMGVALDFHTFTRSNDTVGAYRLNGTTSWGTTGTSKDIGTEIDLTVTCNKVKNLTWQAGYSTFSAGDYGKSNITGTTETTASMGYVMATASF